MKKLSVKLLVLIFLLNIARVDPRIFTFPASAGIAEERQNVFDYQIALFEKKKEIMPLVEEYSTKKNWTFRMGIIRARRPQLKNCMT